MGSEIQELANALLAAVKMAGQPTALKQIGAPSGSLPYADGMFDRNTVGGVLSAMVLDDGLQAWLGFRPSIEEKRTTKILSWVGPQGTAGRSTTWNRTQDCAACPTIEWGKCELLACFGELCASSPVLKATDVGMSAWEGQPILYMQGPKAGLPIRNNDEFLTAIVANVLKQNLNRLTIVGNKTVTPKDFDGLEVLVNTPVVDFRTGNRCEEAEPVIYDWASAAINSTICQVIRAVVRRVRQRSLELGGINLSAGDMILAMTPTMRDSLLDYAACGCGPCSPLVVNNFAQEERARLAGGVFGMGQFMVDGEYVPIIATTWIPETQAAPRFCSDIFVLTRRVGNLPVLYGEYQDFATTSKAISLPAAVNYTVTDNGKFMTWAENERECYKLATVTKPRLVLHAPWVQGRITDVCAPFVLPPISANPASAYFFANTPETGAYTSAYWYSPC